ncbi:MAG TPA: helix-turn-helix domain-containing protein [Gemmatimonadaceae bacterium]|jgi:predicted site-specific integrase-resolvase
MSFAGVTPTGFLRASEAGQRLGVESNAIYRLIQRGVLDGELRNGTRWYVTLESVERLRAAKQQALTASPIVD